MGGAGNDNLLMPTVDQQGNIWLVGYTSSTNFPVTDKAFQNTLGGANDGFVVMLVP